MRIIKKLYKFKFVVTIQNILSVIFAQTKLISFFSQWRGRKVSKRSLLLYAKNNVPVTFFVFIQLTNIQITVDRHIHLAVNWELLFKLLTKECLQCMLNVSSCQHSSLVMYLSRPVLQKLVGELILEDYQTFRYLEIQS